MDYLDFEVEVLPAEVGDYQVRVRSEFGEAAGTVRLPFDTLALQNRLQSLQIALLRSAAQTRRVRTPEERVVQQFGRELFEALFEEGSVRGRFEATRDGAEEREMGVRIKLRIPPPELAALPWEYLYDPARDDFLGLSISTPLVRHIPVPRAMRPIRIEPPLRVLGMIAASPDLPSLDVDRERQRVEIALQELSSRGAVEVEWLPNGTWRELQEWLLRGPWHVFHFIGHGGFDELNGEGFVLVPGENGGATRLGATGLGRLLGDHDPLRLAVLNSCEGARSDAIDVFSSTAATLVQRGTPGVVAMQYEITDRAAIEFSRSFYTAIALGKPVDGALAIARKSISLELPGTLEWGTPALYTRSQDGVLFRMDAAWSALPILEPAVSASRSEPAAPRPAAPSTNGAPPATQRELPAKSPPPVAPADVKAAEAKPSPAGSPVREERPAVPSGEAGDATPIALPWSDATRKPARPRRRAAPAAGGAPARLPVRLNPLHWIGWLLGTAFGRGYVLGVLGATLGLFGARALIAADGIPEKVWAFLERGPGVYLFHDINGWTVWLGVVAGAGFALQLFKLVHAAWIVALVGIGAAILELWAEGRPGASPVPLYLGHEQRDYLLVALVVVGSCALVQVARGAWGSAKERR